MEGVDDGVERGREHGLVELSGTRRVVLNDRVVDGVLHRPALATPYGAVAGRIVAIAGGRTLELKFSKRSVSYGHCRGSDRAREILKTRSERRGVSARADGKHRISKVRALCV